MHRRTTTTRTGFVAGVGAFLLTPAIALGATEEDEALLRLAASAELVTIPYLYRAAASRHFTADERRQLRAARIADGQHYRQLVRAIGPEPPVSQDFDIAFPAKAFASRTSTLELGRTLVGTTLGIYVQLASSLQDASLRALAARICAGEASHASLVSALAGASVVGPALAAPVDAEQASTTLAPFWG